MDKNINNLDVILADYNYINQQYLIPGLVDDVVLYHMVKNLSFKELMKLYYLNKKWNKIIPSLITTISSEDAKLLNDAKLKTFTKLRSLDLNRNNNITDNGIKHLINLTSLILNHNYKITDN